MIKWLLVLACAFVLHANAVQVTDDRGVVIDLPQPTRRIVSLLPSLTEVVCELGACDRLVGVDNYSNWPAPVRKLPRLGGLEDANIETIVSLKPDLVLMGYSSRSMGRLEGLGIKVMALEPETLGDLRRVWTQVGRALAANDVQQLWDRVQAGVDAAARSLPASLRGTTVYFEVNSGPYAASEASFIGELLARIGAANVVPAQLGPFPKLNPEFVVRADPQVIMISDRNAQALNDRPGWDRIRAVRAGRRPSITTSQASRSSAPPWFCPSHASKRARSRWPQAEASRSSNCTRPRCGSSWAKALSRVVLPAPLGPTMAVQRPAGSARSMPCSTSMPPSVTRRPSASSATAVREALASTATSARRAAVFASRAALRFMPRPPALPRPSPS
jgi:iron complex transport system substrate-binding protein